MTGEETKQLKEKFRKRFVWDQDSFAYIDDEDTVTAHKGEDVWDWILSEIITPYEKQLEQVEREKTSLCYQCGQPSYICCFARGMKFGTELYLKDKSQNTQTK